MVTKDKPRAKVQSAVDEPLPVKGMSTEGMDIDFSVVKAMDPVEDGKDYLCVISEWKASKSSKGFPMYDITYEVQEPEYYAGRKMVRNYSLQPQALFGLLNVLVALGDDPEKLRQGKTKVVPSEKLGLPIVVKARNEVFEDQERSKPGRVKHADKWEPWTPQVADTGHETEDEEEKVAAY